MTKPAVEIYDTTLRDGTQQEGISLTVGDKLNVSRLLDGLGVAYIEGGWPGANPKDDEFFQRAKTELELETATLVAFGSTRRANARADEDPTLASLLAAETDVVCLVAKSWASSHSDSVFFRIHFASSTSVISSVVRSMITATASVSDAHSRIPFMRKKTDMAASAIRLFPSKKQ